MRRLWVLLVAAYAGLGPVQAAAAGPTWEHWQAVAGVFDLGGPRSDGSLVVAGSAALYLADEAGNVTPFARGPGGYREDPGAEAYLAVSAGGHVAAAGCDFTRNDTFLLRLHVPIGIGRLDAPGENYGTFVNLTGVSTLNGIAFDTTGTFDNRLLVSGVAGSKVVIFAIDCNGGVHVITPSAPPLEGGIAVAPSGFGAFGGDLIAPDEVSGRIYAIAPDGSVATVARPALPTGGDIGVESLAFVPVGFLSRGGDVYYADRKTANNPHPGSDSVLRLSSDDLAAAGVQEGDMLVATEGGAALSAVRCSPSCSVIPVIGTATAAHGEGHIVFTIKKVVPTPSPSPSASPRPTPQPAASAFSRTNLVIAVVVVVALLGFAMGLVVGRRRK